jgi:hypothetical protein
MRTAETQANPEQYRGRQGGSVEVPASFGAGRYALAVGTLAGLVFAGVSAHAQSSADIRDRIEATFGLVLGNTAELAVPLTRRALARRSQERDRVEPLSYRATDPEPEPTEQATVEETAPEPAVIEQGSAEDDSEIARLPRPRPVIISEAPGTPDLIGRPLDLVAGAAVQVPEEEESVAATPASAPDVEEAAVTSAAASGEEAAVLIPPEDPASAKPELVAAGACLAIDDVTDKDGDFKRNAKALSADGLCMAQEEFKERRRPWIIQTVTSQRPGPLWAVMHDDEDVSFDNAVQALKRYGGTLVAIETGGKRNLSGIDPNRNFSADGVGCRKLGDNAAPRFTGFFGELFDKTQTIVALHNDSEDHIPSGGLGHVSMGHVPRGMRAAAVPDGSLASEYALVLLTVSDFDDATAASRTAVLNKAGINVVLERVRKGRGDCSLSNYAVLTGRSNYFNVTVNHDEGDIQGRIVEVLMNGRSETVASQ